MRARTVAALLSVVVAACGSEPAPPVVEASEVEATASPSPSVDPDEAKLAELRGTDQFDEFAEHERAAKADGARLAWENFAPIVDGKRVEWTNKAELWDSIAPKIRDEALLLGPEYRKPLWNTRNAIPNGISMAWNNEDTGGRGEFVEFSATYEAEEEARQRYWGFLVDTASDGTGQILRVMPALETRESDFPGQSEEADHVARAEWDWIVGASTDA